MLHNEAKAHQIRHLQWRELKTAEHVIVKNSTYDECVIEGCKDMSYSEDMLPFTDSGSKSYSLLLGLPGLPLRLT